jgi:tRNA(Met) cytidine acetyltransferase
MGQVAAQTRRLLLICDRRQPAIAWLGRQLALTDPGAVLWLGDLAPAPVEATPPSRVTRELGREYRLVVVDAHAGFHPDAFAAAVGTLRGGGDCVLLVPPLAQWPGFPDPDRARFAAYPQTAADMRGLFIERLARLWQHDPTVTRATAESAPSLRIAAPDRVDFSLSDAQEEAVAAIERAATGHARRPLVISADRGRGKSTVLGVAASRLLQQGFSRITVVASHRGAVSTLFRHARATLGLGGDGVVDLAFGSAELRFRLPHELLDADDQPPGLLLVDEAAAVPVPTLERLLDCSNRLVFASTLHGYEGSGRGFELRFTRVLQRRMPQWRALRLEPPLRWAADDPLEVLVNRALVLDADTDAVSVAGETRYSRVTAQTLANDEALLRATFGLLVTAHYQTRPSDLRQMLENPQLGIWLAQRGAHVVGVLLGVREGGFDEPMAAEVLAGRRRPRGHLLPQSLAVHAGLDAMLYRQVLRIQRIAVHPGCQREGIGRGLIEALAQNGGDADLLGCAYGVDEAVLAFWTKVGFRPVRVGLRVDAASAAHSLFMLRGLNAVGRALTDTAERRFRQQLPWALAGSLADLPAELAVQLLATRDCSDLPADGWECEALARVAAGSRAVASAEALLWRALVRLAAAETTDAAVLAPLLAWQLQHRSLDTISRRWGLDGRRGLEQRLRDVLKDHPQPLLSSG